MLTNSVRCQVPCDIFDDPKIVAAQAFNDAYMQLTQQSTGNVDWSPAFEYASGGGVGWGWRDVAGDDSAVVFISEVTTLQAAPTSTGFDRSFAAIVAVAHQTTPTGQQWVYAYDHTQLPPVCRPRIQCTVTSGDGSTADFVSSLGPTLTYVSYNSATQRVVVRRSTMLGFEVKAGDCVEASVSLAATTFTLGCGGERRIYGLDRARSTGPNIIAPGATDQRTSEPLLNDGVLRASATTC